MIFGCRTPDLGQGITLKQFLKLIQLHFCANQLISIPRLECIILNPNFSVSLQGKFSGGVPD